MKEKTKKIIKFSFYALLVLILIYDTYNLHFRKGNHEPIPKLSVEYVNGYNIMLNHIKEGNSVSLNFKVKNDTEKPIYYQLSFEDVINELDYSKSATYSFSKDKGNIEIDSEVFPKEDLKTKDIDEIDPSEEIDYVLTVRIGTLESTDQDKKIEAKVKILESDL